MSEKEENKENEENEGGKLSSAIGSGIKYAIVATILYYAAKWLGWV
ncbi:hypothetical protein [Candidatus Puniceispirillum marinum]|nr:hypothetical protein [Candidatus Puniceispirillum marinum]